MPTTDEELAKKAEHVQKLREKVAAATAQRLDREKGLANDIAMAQLTAEETRLQAELDEADRRSKAAAVKEGAAGVLATLKEEQVNADARAKAEAAAAAASKAPSGDDDEKKEG
jgi:hypothetical protein